MTRFVQHDTVTALENSGKSNLSKCMIVFFSGSRNRNEGCLFCGRDALLDGARQSDIFLFQK